MSPEAKMNDSPLQGLVVDGDAIRDEILAGLLRDRVQLAAPNGIVFRSTAVPLSVRSRVLIGILGGAALHRLGHRRFVSVSPKELEDLIGVPGGTVRPALRELVSRRLVRAENGRYQIPSYAIDDVRRALE